MPDPDSEGIVSESELIYLTEFFRQFEGATDPFSSSCGNARRVFYDTLRNIYFGRVRSEFTDECVAIRRSYHGSMI